SVDLGITAERIAVSKQRTGGRRTDPIGAVDFELGDALDAVGQLLQCGDRAAATDTGALRIGKRRDREGRAVVEWCDVLRVEVIATANDLVVAPARFANAVLELLSGAGDLGLCVNVSAARSGDLAADHRGFALLQRLALGSKELGGLCRDRYLTFLDVLVVDG